MVVGLGLRLAGAAFSRAPVTTSIVLGGAGLAGYNELEGLSEKTKKELLKDRLANDPTNFGEFDDLSLADKVKLGISKYVGGKSVDSADLGEAYQTLYTDKVLTPGLAGDRSLIRDAGLTAPEIGSGVTLQQAKDTLAPTVSRAKSEIQNREILERAATLDETPQAKREANRYSEAMERLDANTKLQNKRIDNQFALQFQAMLDAQSDKIDLQRLQLADAREAQREKNDLYRQNMQMYYDNEQKKRFSGIATALATLGTAFAI